MAGCHYKSYDNGGENRTVKERERLQQGAPTSPIISNFICAKLDTELMALAKRYYCTYTRYADDLTFSSTRKEFPKKMEDEIKEVINKNGFSVNSLKTRLHSRNQSLEVTGVKVNERPNVRRTYIRQIKAMLHAWEKFGLDSAQEEYYKKYYSGNKYPEDPKSAFGNIVKGKINYLRMVRGEEDEIYRGLAIRYNKVAVNSEGISGLFPNYDLVDKISAALWVTNSENDQGDLFQGTAFMVENIGLVTCAHIIASAPSKTTVHRYDNPSETFDVEIKHIDTSRDIAIMSVSGVSVTRNSLKTGESKHLKTGSNIIVAGFPNYSDYDTPYFNWGKVTLYRLYKINHLETQRRFMVSSTIIAGNSGGPVLNNFGEVVGIAVTGQELFIPPAEQNEKHGVIPIEEINRFFSTRGMP